MKKFFITMVVSLLAICFSEEFNGFLGIEWGTERKACIDAMTANGWKWQNSKYNDSEQFSGKTYGGKKIENVSFWFDGNDCLRSIVIHFSNYDDVNKVYDALIKKYDLGYILKERGFFTRDLGTGFYALYGIDGIEIRDYEYDIEQKEMRAKLQAERNKVDDSDL